MIRALVNRIYPGGPAGRGCGPTEHVIQRAATLGHTLRSWSNPPLPTSSWFPGVGLISLCWYQGHVRVQMVADKQS